MEIPLPDEDGRVEILNIHTADLKKKQKLAPDAEVKVSLS
jgi:ATP-dependent 26S proteasome regulatory subunit